MARKILILCTGNSCRSQIAEGLVNADHAGHWEAVSAGTNPSGYVHPLAVAVMHELGIDLSQNQSQSTERFTGRSFDLVLTVCDSAQENCPIWPGAKRVVHIPFFDPAEAEGDLAAQTAVFRRVRDEIRSALTTLLTAA